MNLSAADLLLNGLVKREIYPNATRDQVANNAAGTPSTVTFLPTFEIPVDSADNYSDRVNTLFTPPVTGDYVFFLSADDDADLYLSTDATPATRRLIAQEASWSNNRQWTLPGGGTSSAEAKRSDQFIPTGATEPPFAAGIRLTAGQKYYLEAIHHEGSGGDNLSVTYKLVADADPENGEATKLSGNVIAVSIPAPTQLTITNQPQSRSVYAGATALFSIGVSTDSQVAPTIQWRRNGAIIPGATGANYSLVAAPADNSATFDAVVTVPGLTNTSAVATLTVPATAGATFSGLKHELWSGASRADIEAGRVGVPTFVRPLSLFETPADTRDNYADRVSGYFTPDTTGDYVFFISSDDDSSLFLSTDANPANKRLIAQETAWSAARAWTSSGGGSDLTLKRSDTFSTDGGATMPFANGIRLTAGQKYYIEAVHREGNGGDNLGVTFKLLAEADPVDNDPSRLTGNLVSFNTAPVTTLSIVTQPRSITVAEGSATNIGVQVQTDSEITPTYQWRLNGVAVAGETNSTIAIPRAELTNSNARYSVVVSLPGFTNTVTSAEATLTVESGVLSTGFLKREIFPNQTRATVEAGTAGVSTNVSVMTTFESPANVGDNYASRVSGYFLPPATGEYVFFLASDDDTDLFLSTDENPANKKLIAQEASWSNARAWNTPGGTSTIEDKRSDTFALSEWPTPNVISLTAGRRYYIEAVHHDGTGGDHVMATFKLATDADPADGTPSAFGGTNIAFLAPRATLTITQQPESISTPEGQTATFSVGATSDSAFPGLSYQWLRNGVAIPGATSATYTTGTLTAADNNAQFAVRISGPGIAPTNSQAAILTVTGDRIAPAVVSATRPYNGGNNEITVTFTEPVSAATAANYTVNNGVTVTGARFGGASNIVILTVTGLNVAANNQVTVNGVQDLFGNSVVANSQANVTLGRPSVLFVVTNAAALNAADQGIVDRLRARGFPVEIIGAAVSQTTDADRHDFVIVSSTITSGDVAAKFQTVDVPTMTWEQAIQDDFLTTGNTDGTDRGTVDAQTALNIINAGHPLAGGLPAGNVVVTTTATPFSWGSPVAGAVRIATIAGNTNQVAIYGVDEGVALFDGTVAPARRVHFFMGDATFATLTQAGYDLFDAAVNWAVGIETTTGPTLQIARNGANLQISWQGSGFRLQESTNLTTWTDVAGATSSPVTVQTTGRARFFRVAQ